MPCPVNSRRGCQGLREVTGEGIGGRVPRGCQVVGVERVRSESRCEEAGGGDSWVRGRHATAKWDADCVSIPLCSRCRPRRPASCAPLACPCAPCGLLLRGRGPCSCAPPACHGPAGAAAGARARRTALPAGDARSSRPRFPHWRGKLHPSPGRRPGRERRGGCHPGTRGRPIRSPAAAAATSAGSDCGRWTTTHPGPGGRRGWHP